MDKNEVVEHIVVVDEYISAILKIPKELSALDLKALMVKSNKLLNLAEVRIYDGPERSTQKYDTSRKFNIDERTNAVKTWFTGNGTIKEELAKTLDMKRNVLARKVSYWRHRHNIDISGLTLNTNERGRKIKPLKKKNSGDWTTYEVKKLKELYNKHTITELTEIFGRTKIAIYDKASLEGLTIILKQQNKEKTKQILQCFFEFFDL